MRRKITRLCITWQFTERRLPWQILLSIALINLGFDLLRLAWETADIIFVAILVLIP